MKRNAHISAAVLTLLMPLAFAFALTGCEQPTDPLTGKTPLATPANVRVDDAGKTAFFLKWDAVEGADSYTLDIDGELKSVSGSTTNYDLKALTEDPKVYPIRVRAVAYNGNEEHSDSAYSVPLNVEPAEYVFTYTDDISPSLSVKLGRGIARAAGGKTITGLTGYGKGLEKIVIPPKIGSATVTAIGDDAFKDNPVMTAITLPETLITIGAGALSGTNISSIIIPESVLTIGDGAFSNIIVLVMVVFVSPEPPALGSGVFTGSDAIEAIVTPDGKGDAYAEKIEEAAPELAGKVEEVKEEKFLIAIEVGQPPVTDYTEGQQFSTAGMTVIARYSDTTTAPITDYEIMLASPDGAGFSKGNRALNLSDKVVRLSYTEDRITRTKDIAIKVTEPAYTISWTVTPANSAAITTNPSGSATAGTKVTVNVRPNQGYTIAAMLSVKDANGKDVDDVQAADTAGTIWTFTMPASNVAITGTFTGGTPPPSGYSIIISKTTGGTITTDPSGRAAAGTTVKIFVTVNQGYTFDSSNLSVVADNYPVNYQINQAMTGPVYTFTMPDSDVLISGTFTGGDGSLKLSGMSVVPDATGWGCTATDFAYISWGNTPTSLSTLMTGSPKVTVSTSSSMGGKLLSIELYAAKPDEWTLFDIEKFDYVAVGLTATPNDAQYQQIYSFYESTGGYLLQLLDEAESQQYLYYVDKDVTLSGTTDRGISANNVILRQGWNFVYTEANSADDGWDLIATQTLPQGWYWSLTED